MENQFADPKKLAHLRDENAKADARAKLSADQLDAATRTLERSRTKMRQYENEIHQLIIDAASDKFPLSPAMLTNTAENLVVATRDAIGAEERIGSGPVVPTELRRAESEEDALVREAMKAMQTVSHTRGDVSAALASQSRAAQLYRLKRAERDLERALVVVRAAMEGISNPLTSRST